MIHFLMKDCKRWLNMKISNYISGDFCTPDSDELEDYSPATGEVIALIPKSGKDDVDVLFWH